MTHPNGDHFAEGIERPEEPLRPTAPLSRGKVMQPVSSFIRGVRLTAVVGLTAVAVGGGVLLWQGPGGLAGAVESALDSAVGGTVESTPAPVPAPAVPAAVPVSTAVVVQKEAT